MKINKQEIITRLIIVIIAFGAIVGSLMPMFAININFFGKRMSSQDFGILSLFNKANTGGVIDKINTIGQQNMDGIGKKILGVMIQPISLYSVATLFVIVIMIGTMVNKLNKLRILLSIATTLIDVYLISVMQNLPNKLMQSISLNNTSGIIKWSKFIEINIGISHWIMLAAAISMMITTILSFFLDQRSSI